MVMIVVPISVADCARASSVTLTKSKVPKSQKMVSDPRITPASPMRLVMNALLAAVEAECL